MIVLYDTTDRFRVLDERALQEHLQVASACEYVYVLCYPPFAQLVRPFYVGVGRGNRLFQHEREAANPTASGLKISIIREIVASGSPILRFLDGLFAQTPWQREQELIAQLGLLKDRTGVLANEQRYSPSFIDDGVELRKYAADGNELPANFTHRNTRLIVGPKFPKNSASVYGKICAVVDANPGITGSELVELLLTTDFSDNNTAYSALGQVSRPWLAKYIDGAFYRKNRYLQAATNSRPP